MENDGGEMWTPAAEVLDFLPGGKPAAECAIEARLLGALIGMFEWAPAAVAGRPPLPIAPIVP